MSDYVDSFIKSHKEYFKRNSKVIESNSWNDNSKYENQMREFAESIAIINNENSDDKDKLLKSIEKEIRAFNDSSKKSKEALFKQENELTMSILGRLSVFISESQGDRHLSKTQEFIDDTASIINIHLKKCDDYLKYNMDILTQDVDTEEEIDYKSYEIVFQDNVFNKKIEIHEKLSKLNINNSVDNLSVKFFKDEKASLLMRQPLIVRNLDIQLATEASFSDINLSTSKELLINMRPKDIPQWNPKKHYWEQSKDVLQFWAEEHDKVVNGININGYRFHPWLYWHLNVFKTPIPQPDGTEPVIHPYFRDNEWFFVESLKQAEDAKDKGLLLYGTRRFTKSVILASYIQWKSHTKANAVATLTGGSEKDLLDLTDKVRTSMDYTTSAFKLEVQKQSWDGGNTILGLKEDASNIVKYSTISVINLAAGAKSSSQKTAGGAPSAFVNDEIGKYNFLKSYLAALPSFETPYGFKCVPILVGTAGEEGLSKDANTVLSDPGKYNLLGMDWDLLESKIDPEHITWKRKKFGMFVPAQMAYKEGFVKLNKPFDEFLGIESELLNNLNIQVTDWEGNKKKIMDWRAEAKGDLLLEQQRTIQYPIDPEECLMSSEENPFPALEAKRHKEYLIESGESGKRVTIMQDSNGRIFYEMNNKPLADYPHPGGFIDAPVVLYEELPGDKPIPYLYVAGFDDYKQEESGTDSVGSFHIYKVNIGMDKWCGRIVASVSTRPDPHNKLYRQIFLLMQAFNAKCFMENADMGFKEYLDRKRATDLWLVESMDFKSDMSHRSNGRRRYGWAPTPENKRFLLNLAINYAKQEFSVLDEDGIETTVLGIQLINDIGLLDEMISYKKDNNVDRITSFMSCLGYEFFLYNNYMLPTTTTRKIRDDVKESRKPEKSLAERLYGGSVRQKRFF
jgi:hypothetical protein